MPNKENTKSWIEEVLGEDLTPNQIDWAIYFHKLLHKDGQDEIVSLGFKPAAIRYFRLRTIQSLSQPNIDKLEESHNKMPQHEYNPKNLRGWRDSNP